MKKLIVLFLMVFTFSYSVKAQIPMFDIYTPKCSLVLTYITSEDAYNTRLGYDADYKTRYPAAQQVVVYDGLRRRS